jgi:hypothetical protein
MNKQNKKITLTLDRQILKDGLQGADTYKASGQFVEGNAVNDLFVHIIDVLKKMKKDKAKKL